MRTLILIGAFLLLTAPMLWNIVSAAQPAFVIPCSKTTCKALDDNSNLPNGPIGILNILVISDSQECPGHCAIVTTSVGEIHAVGNYIDLWCQVWGGTGCSFKDMK